MINLSTKGIKIQVKADNVIEEFSNNYSVNSIKVISKFISESQNISSYFYSNFEINKEDNRYDQRDIYQFTSYKFDLDEDTFKELEELGLIKYDMNNKNDQLLKYFSDKCDKNFIAFIRKRVGYNDYICCGADCIRYKEWDELRLISDDNFKCIKLGKKYNLLERASTSRLLNSLYEGPIENFKKAFNINTNTSYGNNSSYQSQLSAEKETISFDLEDHLNRVMQKAKDAEIERIKQTPEYKALQEIDPDIKIEYGTCRVSFEKMYDQLLNKEITNA